jgi:glycosyltransferase involved in cell wall biosynthesis
MNVLYDHQIYSSQVYGGISRYFYELMRCFAADSTVDFELALRYSNNSYLRDAGFVHPETFFRNRRFFGKTTLLNFINRSYSIRSLLGNRHDVFHPTYYDPYFLRYIGSKPYVVTVYDMIHELYPQMFPSGDRTQRWKKASLQNAAKIIAISESTKNDVIGFYGLDESKVRVIHLASSLQIGTAARIPPDLPERYLLFVGQRSGYKNFARFVAALVPVLKKNLGLSVVCAGGGGFTQAEIAMMHTEGVSDRFRQYPVNDDLLAALYKNALLFAFPSLYEGFGIPVLEAFGCGCPVLAGNRSSLPEIGGDAAHYFDPLDQQSLRDALEQAVDDQNLREDLARKGLEQLKKFSWERAALETKAVYESCI